MTGLVPLSSRLAIIWGFLFVFRSQSLETNRTVFPITSKANAACYCFPNDECWPTISEFDEFNRTIDGKLIATIPIASQCHQTAFSNYDPEACKTLQSVWFEESTHYTSSSSVMAPFFANRSCDPFSPPATRCVIGTYTQYTVNASQASDYQKTLGFVQQHNIRLTVRNTGHDYNAKSTGAGAISIWTHHLKNITIMDYQSVNYSGKVMKMGAGVQGYEAYAAAHAQGLLVVGGNCPTVGIAGGYTQGGGHGPLASKFGLAADQVLEWEVVIATGELLHATPWEFSDLYWALSGGGGGTLGVVLSMTTKLYNDMPSTASNLTFTNEGITQDNYYEMLETFHQSLVPLVAAGGVAVWQFTNTSFSMSPAYGPGISVTRFKSIMKPVTDQLDGHGINYTYVVNGYPNFLDSYNAMVPPIPTSSIQLGGRWLPKSLVVENSSALTAAFRTINEKGGGVTGLALDVSKNVTGSVWNAVTPGWRGTLLDMVLYTNFSYTNWTTNIVNQQLMTNELVPELEKLTPGGGAYLSEADFQQPNFQQTLFGSNYPRLLAIKDKYDPNDIFYTLTGVGSERWTVEVDGRLCRVKNG